MEIAIIGAGSVGSNLGTRFTRAGYQVTYGVRSGRDVSQTLKCCGGRAHVASVETASRNANVVILAVPARVAVEVATSLGDLTGKTLVDCTNPLRFDDGPVHAPPSEGSVTAALAQALPGVAVVKAFNTFGAEIHLEPQVAGMQVDTYLAGDHNEAKIRVAELAEAAGFNPVDVGGLRNAAHLESMAVLWIQLAMVEGGIGRRMAFKLLRGGSS